MTAVQETSKVQNPAGVYRHPDSGAEVTLRSHPKFGSAQADAFVRVGYVYVGPASKEEPKKTPVEQPTEVKKGAK